MRMAWSAGALLIAVLAGCIREEETGFVQIKAVPALTGSTLAFYLNDAKIVTLKNGEALLTHKSGTSKLQVEAGAGQLLPLCEIVVSKNRITTVTVSTLSRPPRCQCSHAAGQGPQASRTCAS
jgi:hypothetical protein